MFINLSALLYFNEKGMGIVNREGALYMATGIDNSGLYKGRQEALGIIKAMAGEITSFDVFGGIGISAGIAFASAAKDAYAFEKQFESSMKEVATISDLVKDSMDATKQKIISLTTDEQIPIGANEMAKALYGIVSAGHDGEQGMRVLEVSAKAAVGGITETATAADAITTLLNAYKKDASEAEKVSDMLFTTAKLGKTTFGEMGKSIAQAAPVAAAYGVEMDQVLAAVATLTKQGTPTAQAMTQIRAAIVGVSKYLGDGAYEAMTFQEALEKVRQEAGGSEAKLRSMIPEMEAVNGLLGLTGKNAQEAAGHLDEMKRSVGATEEAFKEMADGAENQLKLLGNNITAMFRPMGQKILEEVSRVSTAINKAFNGGEVEDSLRKLGDLVVIVTGALISYKGSIAAVSVAKKVNLAITRVLASERSAEQTRLIVSKGLHYTEAGAIAKNTSARILLTRALKAQAAAYLKNTAAMLTNPYILAAAALTTLGYGLYKLATMESAAEKATRRHREEQDKFRKSINERKHQSEELLRIIQDESETEEKKIDAYSKLQILSPALTTAYSKEALAVLELAEANKVLNAERDKLTRQNIQSNIKRLQDELKELNKQKNDGRNSGAVSQWMLGSKVETKQEELNKYIKDLRKIKEIKKEARPVEVKLVEAKADLQQIQEEFERAKKKLQEEQEKLKNNPFYTIPFNVEIDVSNAEKKLKETKDKIASLTSTETGSSNSKDIIKNKVYWEGEKKKAEDNLAKMDVSKKGSKDWNKLVSDIAKYQKEIDKYEVLKSVKSGIETKKAEEKLTATLTEQMIERKRRLEDLQTQIDESRIKTMADGSAKTIEEMEINFEKEMQTIDRQKEDALRKNIDNARTAFEADPKNKDRVFDGSGIKLSDDEIRLFDEKYKAAIAVWEKNLADYNQNSKKSWNEYLKEFGDYQQKRQAILDLAQEESEKAGTEGERKSILKRAQNEMDELDNSMRNSSTLMGQLFADASQKSVNEIQKIVDKAELLMRYLESVKDEKGNAVIGGKKVSKKEILDIGISDNTLQNLSKSPEKVEALRNGINKMKDDLKGKSPFKMFETQIGDAIKKIKKGGKGSLAQGISEIGSSIAQFSPAVSQFGKDLGNIIGNDDLGNKISGVSDAIGGLGQTAMGVGQIMSGDIVGGAMAAVSGISQVVDALDGLFGADYAKYEAMKAQYETLNAIWDELIEKKRKYIETSYGIEAVKVSEEAKLLQKKTIESQRILGRELLNSGASAGSHSIGIRIWKKMNDEAWRQARRALGSDWKNRYNDKSRMEWLFDLSAKQLSKLKEAGVFWAKLDDDVRRYLDNIIDGQEKLDEINEQMKNQLTNTSFDSMYENFIDKLMDMKSSTEDFVDDINSSFMRAFLANEIGAKYREKLKKWYDGFADDLKDGKLSDEEVQRRREEYKKYVNDAIRDRDNIAKVTGYTGDADDKGVTGKLQEALTEGTANQLVGLWNMSSLDIRHIKEFLQNIPPEFFRWSDDIRMDVGQIMLLAAEIKNNTERTADNTYGLKEELREIKNEITEVKKNTKGYTGRG